MKGNTFIQYISGLLLATLLIYLFLNSRVDNIKNEKTLTQILSILEYDSRLKHQVTAVKSGNHHNYGGIVVTKTNINNKLAAFRTNPNLIDLSQFKQLNSLMSELTSSYNTKLETLEIIKKQNAIYRNTLYYFPKFIAQTLQKIQASDLLTTSQKIEINNLFYHIEADVFRYNAQTGFKIDDLNLNLINKRHQISQQVPFSLLPDINRAFKHINLISELNESLNDKINLVLSNSTTHLLESLYRNYQIIIRQQEHTALIFQTWLFALTFLLLIYLATTYFKLKAMTLTLNQTLNDLEFHKYAIDQHSIVSITDLSGTIIYANNRFCEVSKYSEDELIGKKHNIISSGRHSREFFEDMWDTISSGQIWHGIIANSAKDGSTYWVDSTLLPRLDSDGNPYQYIGIRTDITALKNAEKEIELLARFPSENPDPVIRLSGNGEVLYANDASIQILNHWKVNIGEEIPLEWKTINQRSLFEDVIEEHEIIIDDVYYNFRFIPVFSEFYVNLYARNITDIKNAQSHLDYQSTHDPLTNLPNRRAFEAELDDSLEQAQIKHIQSILLYIDLDQFKIINDTCGHVAGDELIRQVGSAIARIIRDSDTLARLGGDEYGVILSNCDTEHGAYIANKILNALYKLNFTWVENSFEISASIGLVPISDINDSGVSLLSKADIACYAAKDSGRNRVQVYQPNDEIEKRQDEMLWASRIPAAIAENRFILYAQLIKPIDPGILHSHYEILVRLQDEDGQLIPPGAFIPAAEKYGIMNSLDMWVIKTAFEMLGPHNSRYKDHPVHISINLSGQSIGNDHILEYVPSLIALHQIDPALITFEITETSAIENLSSAMDFIREVKALGCKFSLDDFGSGLSSFSYLKNMQVDYLKIDGAFVKDILVDPIDEAMVQSINQIGHVMNIQTIAEFVETTDIETRLKGLSVDFAQGYGIEKPRPFSEILAEDSIRDTTISAT